jgi:hypothetical protein
MDLTPNRCSTCGDCISTPHFWGSTESKTHVKNEAFTKTFPAKSLAFKQRVCTPSIEADTDTFAAVFSIDSATAWSQRGEFTDTHMPIKGSDDVTFKDTIVDKMTLDGTLWNDGGV